MARNEYDNMLLPTDILEALHAAPPYEQALIYARHPAPLNQYSLPGLLSRSCFLFLSS